MFNIFKPKAYSFSAALISHPLTSWIFLFETPLISEKQMEKRERYLVIIKIFGDLRIIRIFALLLKQSISLITIRLFLRISKRQIIVYDRI